MFYNLLLQFEKFGIWENYGYSDLAIGVSSSAYPEKVSVLPMSIYTYDGRIQWWWSFMICHSNKTDQRVPELRINTRWLPQVTSCLQCIKPIQPSFFSHQVRGDEAWILDWKPESAVGSMCWNTGLLPPTRTTERDSRTPTIMASIFWDVRGSLMIDFMQE